MSRWGEPLVRRLYLATKRANEALSQVLAREHVTVATWGALDALDRMDGASQRELAAVVHVEQATMTVQLARMERAGLCRRRTDTRDRRVMSTTITSEGKALLDRIRPLADQAQDRFFGPLTPEQRAELDHLLGLLLGAADHGPEA